MEQQDGWFFGADGGDAAASGGRAEDRDAEEGVAGALGAEDVAPSGRRWGRLGRGTEEAWAGVRESPVGDGSSVLLGAARTGDLVVGVEVWSPPAGDPEGLLGGLLEAAVLELREADPGGAAG